MKVMELHQLLRNRGSYSSCSNSYYTRRDAIELLNTLPLTELSQPFEHYGIRELQLECKLRRIDRSRRGHKWMDSAGMIKLLKGEAALEKGSPEDWADISLFDMTDGDVRELLLNRGVSASQVPTTKNEATALLKTLALELSGDLTQYKRSHLEVECKLNGINISEKPLTKQEIAKLLRKGETVERKTGIRVHLKTLCAG